MRGGNLQLFTTVIGLLFHSIGYGQMGLIDIQMGPIFERTESANVFICYQVNDTSIQVVTGSDEHGIDTKLYFVKYGQNLSAKTEKIYSQEVEGYPMAYGKPFYFGGALYLFGATIQKKEEIVKSYLQQIDVKSLSYIGDPRQIHVTVDAKILEMPYLDYAVSDDGNYLGLIDAEATLNELTLPEYQVLHKSGTSSDYDLDVVSSFQGIYVTDLTAGLLGPFLGDVVDVTYTFEHSIPGTATLLDGWARSSTIDGYVFEEPSPDYYITIPQPPGSVDLYIDETTAVIKTRLYKVTHSFAGFDITDVWLPAPPSEIVLDYSLHIYDPFATNVEEELIGSDKIFVCPNPASDFLTVKLSEASSGISYQIFSLDGKLVATSNSAMLENNTFTVDISRLIAGLYYLNIINDEINTGVNFVKQ